MPRRGRHRLSSGARRAAFAGVGMTAALAACQTDVGDAGCQLTQQVALVASPLTLLPDARIDPIGTGFILIGSDGTAVRWASLTADGAISNEQALALPAGVTQPLYAVAGQSTAADTIIVAYVSPAANGVDAELRIIVAAADGSSPGKPGDPVITFPAGAASIPTVALASSRPGMDAGLAWVGDDGSGAGAALMYAAVDAHGKLVATPVVVDHADAYACLGFGAGENDLTVSYLRAAGGDSRWATAEATEAGAVVSTLQLPVAQGGRAMSCALATPTGNGVALVWQDSTGSWLSVYDTGSGQVHGHPFASATDFGGADVQPPLVGLAPFGSDFGVLLARPRDIELWRLDASGNRRMGALIFPSIQDNFGEISTVSARGSLTATYADYVGPAGSTSTGSRLFINAACY